MAGVGRSILPLVVIVLCLGQIDGQCNIGQKTGDVFEKAPDGTLVINLQPDGNENEITLTLDNVLDDYFSVNWNDSRTAHLLVSNSDALVITGGSTLILGNIICTEVSGSGQDISTGLTITMKYINDDDPTMADENETISEFYPIDQNVLQMQGTDPDGGDTLSYTITSQNPDGFFNIRTNGWIYAIKTLEYSVSDTYTLNIELKDSGFDSNGDPLVRTATAIATIYLTDVDNLPPVFQPTTEVDGVTVAPLYTMELAIGNDSVNDNLDSYITPGPINAVDGDTSLNAAIVYAFVEDQDYYAIDATTGSVSLKAEVVTRGVSSIAVKATQADNPNRYAISYLQVTVVDNDEHKPTFNQASYDGYLPDSSTDDIVFVTEADGVTLLQVNATDADPGSQIVYQITPPFQITSDGYIYVSSSELTKRALSVDQADITAININADSNSPNRESDVVQLSVSAVPTTEAPTTEEPTTVAETTPQPTTIDPTTTDLPTTSGDEAIRDPEEQLQDCQTTLYVLIGILALLIIICILLIIYLCCYRKKMEKRKGLTIINNPYPNEKHPYENQPFDKASTSTTSHENRAYDEIDETSSKEVLVKQSPQPFHVPEVVTVPPAQTGAPMRTTYVSTNGDILNRPEADEVSIKSDKSDKVEVDKISQDDFPVVNNNSNGYVQISDDPRSYKFVDEDNTDDDKKSISNESTGSLKLNKLPVEEDETYFKTPAAGGVGEYGEDDFPPPQPEPDYMALENEEEIAKYDATENLQNETPVNDPFKNEIAARAALLTASASTIAGNPKPSNTESVVPKTEDGDPEKRVPLTEDMIEVQSVLKNGTFGDVNLVLIKSSQKADVKGVSHSLNTALAPSVDAENARAKIKLLESLSDREHPNILQYLGNYTHLGTIHIVMAWMENGKLSDYLRANKNSSKLSPHRLMLIIADIGNGMQYLRGRNIVHGNLQASNVMLDGDLVPKLSDFENNLFKNTDLGNRMPWMALEVLDSQSDFTFSSDIWSYGITMWEVVSFGEVPYVGVDRKDLYNMVQHGRLRRPKRCSRALFAVIESCWITEPSMRPDIYSINTNLAEKLIEDSNQHIFASDQETDSDPMKPTRDEDLTAF